MKIPTALLMFLLALGPAQARESQPKLRVATRAVKPFVVEEKGRLSGFSIDLWQEISKQMNVRYDFVVKPTVKDLLDAVKSKEADLGIAAISITAEREIEWDFSFPMFEGGLQILTLAQTSESGFPGNIISGVFTAAFLPILGIVLLTILIPAHVVWLFERRQSSGLLTNRSYFPGIFEASWWAAATLATQADQMPRSAAARIMAVIWMFTSVVFIAYFTASVTSSLTVQQLRGDIKGPEDLPGKRVATVRGSTSASYLEQHDIKFTEFTRVEETYQALEQGQADAVVYDAPVLLYYAAHEGKGKTQVVGPIFRKESYGIVFPSNSPYRKPVNEALLLLKEKGIYDQFYKKWFGSEGT